jgi:hypothetical protein
MSRVIGETAREVARLNVQIVQTHRTASNLGWEQIDKCVQSRSSSIFWQGTTSLASRSLGGFAKIAGGCMPEDLGAVFSAVGDFFPGIGDTAREYLRSDETLIEAEQTKMRELYLAAEREVQQQADQMEKHVTEAAARMQQADQQQYHLRG